jgi:hypothetical protein
MFFLQNVILTFFCTLLFSLEMVEPVPESIDFAQEEGKILEYWKKIDAFKTSLKLSKGKPR